MSVPCGVILKVRKSESAYDVLFNSTGPNGAPQQYIQTFETPKFFVAEEGDFVALYSQMKPFIYLNEDIAIQLKKLFNWYPQTITRLIERLEEVCTEDETPFTLLCDAAENYNTERSNNCLSLFIDLVPGKNIKIAHKLLRDWNRKVVKRRLFLLGFTNTEINESEMTCRELYESALNYPFDIPSISFSKCIDLCTVTGKRLTQDELDLGTLTKSIMARLGNKYISLAVDYIKTLEPNYEKYKDRLKSFTVAEDRIYRNRDYVAETQIVDFVTKMSSRNKFNRTYKPPKSVNLTEEQKNACKMALIEPGSIITGGPGTGKTTSLQGLIENLIANGARVLVASFMGKAVDRCNEVLGHLGVDTMTIHSVVYHVGPPVYYDHIIVEECSTAENLLLALLFKKYPNASYTFVGDPNQIEPVGKGQAFRDLIDCCFIPVAKLTLNKRSEEAPGIAQFADAIINYNGGALPVGNQHVILLDGTNLQDIINYVALWKQGGITDLMFTIITPYKDIPTMLNPVAQQIFCPENSGPVCSIDFMGYRIGAKLMITKNNHEIGVMNGQSARLVDILSDRAVIEVKRGLRAGLTKELEKAERAKSVVERDGKLYEKIEIWRSIDEEDPDSNRKLQGKDTVLGYSMTVHKAQGSEWPYVILFIPDYTNPSFAHKNLIYTAITRAQKAVYVFGSIRKFYECILTERKIDYSTLAKRLKDKHNERIRPLGDLDGVGSGSGEGTRTECSGEITEFRNLNLG